MPWLQLTLTLPAQQAQIASEILEEIGAIAVTLQDAVGEIKIETEWDQRPIWSKVGLSALLPEETDPASVGKFLVERLELPDVPDYRLERVDDKDWATAWKEHYKPIHMGGDLWICPSWCTPPSPNAVNVILDPGMAFGTGDHPTTALCLEWLAHQNLRDKLILDYGCGSGILAIGAALFGAHDIDAVDIDPAAVESTRANAQANGVTLNAGLPEAADGSYPLVLANILATPLKLLAPLLCGHVADGGDLVLAGILERQADELKQAYAPWLALDVSDSEDGWILMTARKVSSS
jgi:ribosomal protein L11 methyltransferase